MLLIFLMDKLVLEHLMMQIQYLGKELRWADFSFELRSHLCTWSRRPPGLHLYLARALMGYDVSGLTQTTIRNWRRGPAIYVFLLKR